MYNNNNVATTPTTSSLPPRRRRACVLASAYECLTLNMDNAREIVAEPGRSINSSRLVTIYRSRRALTMSSQAFARAHRMRALCPKRVWWVLDATLSRWALMGFVRGIWLDKTIFSRYVAKIKEVDRKCCFYKSKHIHNLNKYYQELRNN